MSRRSWRSLAIHSAVVIYCCGVRVIRSTAELARGCHWQANSETRMRIEGDGPGGSCAFGRVAAAQCGSGPVGWRRDVAGRMCWVSSRLKAPGVIPTQRVKARRG